MNLTSIVSKVFLPRQKELRHHIHEGERLQQQVLSRLVARASDTEWGRSHSFDSVDGYSRFIEHVPLNSYEQLKEAIDRMRHGESDVLWPGRVKWFAKSSGTTNDKSKFIPVTEDGLRDIHFQGTWDTVSLYLMANPRSRLFDGRALILGGSHSPNYNVKDSMVGDLSAILIENMNPLANLVRVPKKSTALLSDFDVKREHIAMETWRKNVTNLSGVPSWMMSVLMRVLELSGCKTIDEVWPNLEVFFHGGVSFKPYRQQYADIIRNPEMHYMETYNASEGFFGVQSSIEDPSLLLLLDRGVFYEFIPMDEFSESDLQQSPEHLHAVPLWGVETGKNYALVISTSCGLWRYVIGDTICFTQKNPYKFVITGRTKHFINAFGEELIVDNAEKGLEYACRMTNAEVKDYTAAPIYMDTHAKCRHQWLIEFSREPDDLDRFATLLDQKLQEINSDYEAKRFKDITLQHLEVVKARPNLFNDWLKCKGKLGGQHKIPRLSNSRRLIEEIMELGEKE
ncbi:MAG: GH3 auxin-responsive promoter family protein [Prevotella sp.]|nr:GH3 auxin-responsive promoter family protein [Prevotella sp.]